MRYVTGISKLLLYIRIAVDVAIRYMFRMNPVQYVVFLRRASILLCCFWHNKTVKMANGYKLQLYLPAYPSKAFFYTIDSKLLRKNPGPATVVYSMTKACNYKCPHCYQRCDQGIDMSEQVLAETARKIHEAGVSMFDIEGGEPFLRFERLKKIFTVLDEESEIWVNTHGGDVAAAQLKELKSMGLLGLMVSIHSPQENLHDEFTGIPGSFKNACRTIKIARELGLAVTINSVLSAEQIESGLLDDLMELAKSLDCDFVQLIHPKPSGLWLSCEKQIHQSGEVVKAAREKHKQYNSHSFKDYPVLMAQVFEEDADCLGCTAGGVDRFYVNAAGEVQPCEFLNISFGNVNEESFEKIFDRMRSCFSVPCSQWLCCSKSQEIAAMIEKYQPGSTPLKWQYTKELVKDWNRGEPTKLYGRLGVYQK
ncbi:MAG: radical SAM/SPASM domain-containing protein [Sedimentisphaeraceae bacterium JB056]